MEATGEASHSSFFHLAWLTEVCSKVTHLHLISETSNAGSQTGVVGEGVAKEDFKGMAVTGN